MEYMSKIILLIVLCSATLWGHDVFDPQSRPIPKKQIYNQPVKRIYYYIYFISARYGKKFNNAEIQKEFEKQPWYSVNKNYHDSLLNPIDHQNIAMLTALHDSLTKHIRQLKALKSSIVWEKPVHFIENDPDQKCVFTVTKKKNGFKVHVQFQNKDGIYYNDVYSVSMDDFGNEWNGYPSEGAAEAIALNYEFINVEFIPDEKTELSMIGWYQSNRKMSRKQAATHYDQFKKKARSFKGEAYFTGYKNDTLFPEEYIYLSEERSFVLVYTP